MYPWKVKFCLTLFFGITRVFAYIGVGVAGALAVAAVKLGQPFLPQLYYIAIY